MKRIAGTALMALLWAVPSAAVGDDRGSFHFIVNAANPVSTLTRSQASRLLLKKVTRWEDGRNVEPADLAEADAARAALSRNVHGRGTAAIKAYWQQQIFSGSDIPPPEFSSDSAVLAYVKSRPGAVGYVSATPSDAGVKVVKLVP